MYLYHRLLLAAQSLRAVSTGRAHAEWPQNAASALTLPISKYLHIAICPQKIGKAVDLLAGAIEYAESEKDMNKALADHW